MAVTVDASGTDFFNPGPGTVTTISGTPFSTTNITSSATGLAVLVTWNVANNATFPSSISVTYGGTGLTLVSGATIQASQGAQSGQSSIYFMPSPPAGSATLTVTWTTAMNVIVSAVSVKGGDTTTPFKNGTSNSAINNASPSITVNSPVNDLAIGVCGSYSGVAINTVNQTTVFSENGGPFGNGFGNLTAGAGASTTLSGTLTSTGDWVYAACDAQVPSSVDILRSQATM